MNANRRLFLQSFGLASIPLFLQGKTLSTYTVGVIGHTGRGNFGHGLDKMWKMHPKVSVVGVADANPQGLQKALARVGQGTGYLDYRKMLETKRPDFVAVCPRHVDQRVSMIKAACEFGAKAIYVEKPFARSLKECDLISEACKRSGTLLAVAHRNRYHPALAVAIKLIKDGLLGQVLAMQGRGKQDRRGGGEDLWVLGTHVFDLFHAFAGKPVSCTATVKTKGKIATQNQIYEGNEGLGTLVGDEIHAEWKMENGWTATFDSVRGKGSRQKGFGLEIVGEKGTLEILCDQEPLFHFIEGKSSKGSKERIPLTSSGLGKKEREDIDGTVRNHLAALIDLIHCLENGAEPLCGLDEGTSPVSFVSSVFESHRQGGKEVNLPLTSRGNPLLR